MVKRLSANWMSVHNLQPHQAAMSGTLENLYTTEVKLIIIKNDILVELICFKCWNNFRQRLKVKRFVTSQFGRMWQMAVFIFFLNLSPVHATFPFSSDNQVHRREYLWGATVSDIVLCFFPFVWFITPHCCLRWEQSLLMSPWSVAVPSSRSDTFAKWTWQII